MVSVERIEQEIAELQKAVVALATELHRTYLDYLTALGQTVQKQLVLSGFQVCTQGYPTQFLKLSVSQRQELQQSLRTLAKQTQANLLALLHSPETFEKASPADISDLQTLEFNGPPANHHDDASRQSLTPGSLAQWVETLEKAIAGEFREVSHTSNKLLQKAGILPNKLPEFFQAMGKADLPEVGGNPPNLMNFLVASEADDESEPFEEEEDAKPPVVIQIVAIHLRLSEVEFSDPRTNALRNRLRVLFDQLKALGRQYRKKERERAIAQAQDAWRACWYED